MKKLIITLTTLFLISCASETKDDINCTLQGGIIYEITSFKQGDFGPVYYDVKYQGEIITVEPYDIDLVYHVGDTINKPCITNAK